jgi:hypothetical protein
VLYSLAKEDLGAKGGLMRKLVIACFVICVLLPGAAFCRTYNVNPDGSGDATTITGGMGMASPGDTLLVHPGEYVESFYMKDRVALISVGGPAVTTLKHGGPDYWNIIGAPCEGGLIRGFTLQGSPGMTGSGIQIGCSSAGLSTLVEGNVFSDLIAYSGGGVALYYYSNAVITDNLFTNCTGWDAGGGIAMMDWAWARIEGNTFIDCYSKVGGAISCSQGATCEVVGNTMEGNEALQQGGGVFLHECPSGLVEDNLLKHNTCGTTGGGIYVYEGTYEVRRNVLWGNSARDGGGIGQSLGAALTCENNTFYGNTATYDGASARLGGDVPTTFVNCIVSNSIGTSAVDCIRDPLPLADCNVFWENSQNYTGCLPGPHDVTACPSFCFADLGVFDLCSGSPCLPGNHPGGHDCGLIGAMPEGCDCGPTGTESTTWGSIKAIYR